MTILDHSHNGLFKVIVGQGRGKLLQTKQQGSQGFFGNIGLAQGIFFQRPLQNSWQFVLQVTGNGLDKGFAMLLKKIQNRLIGGRAL